MLEANATMELDGSRLLKRKFRAMGTTVELLLETDDDERGRDALEAVRVEFERLEQVMSRFRPDSELSRLNREGSLAVSPDLERVIELALEARERTNGRFDPTIHDALVAAGYDRSFDELPAELDAGARSPVRCGGRVTLDASSGVISVEPGFHLDLGGIGKGYAVDRAVEILAVSGSCLVNAGGDLAVRGERDWPVGVPDGPTLMLTSGAIATPGRESRRWKQAGEEQHHLIDPATGRAARSDLLRVTVVASTAVEAEVLAKTLFLGGEEEAASADLPAVLVTMDGRTRLVGGL
jgi:thiamine biosynthesis lipoprotein